MVPAAPSPWSAANHTPRSLAVHARTLAAAGEPDDASAAELIPSPATAAVAEITIVRLAATERVLRIIAPRRHNGWLFRAPSCPLRRRNRTHGWILPAALEP